MRAVLPELAPELVRGALRDSLAWWRAHDAAQALVAACRAQAWIQDGRWLSKRDAAAAFLDRVQSEITADVERLSARPGVAPSAEP
jgi:hypothetical protein